MRVRVLAFGMLREMLPSGDFSMNLPEGCTVAQMVAQQQQESGLQNAVWQAMAVAVNREYASREQVLREGDEVALLPPVSGGSQEESLPDVSLTRDPIDAEKVLARVRHPEDGAVASFDGIVRNQTRGRQTLYLVYEAYEEMALEQMRQLAHEAKQRFAIHDVVMVHRLGRLEIGESSVLIGVCSAHRAAAFDACRWLIDTLKKTVPIWKKEHFVDGAVWADGDPFPPEMLQ
uniref:Molybdopterin synthase catalytic subunit n=1 Tax=Acidobacterium capsulatum TaxID=33075 RepID=A0A7V5CSY4_9BACT